VEKREKREIASHVFVSHLISLYAFIDKLIFAFAVIMNFHNPIHDSLDIMALDYKIKFSLSSMLEKEKRLFRCNYL